MRYQQESGGSAASTPKPPGSAGATASPLLPRVASEAAMSAALGLNQLVPGQQCCSEGQAVLTGQQRAGRAGGAVPPGLPTLPLPSVSATASAFGAQPPNEACRAPLLACAQSHHSRCAQGRTSSPACPPRAGSSLASLLAGVPGTATTHLRPEGGGSDDGLVPVANLSNK